MSLCAYLLLNNGLDVRVIQLWYYNALFLIIIIIIIVVIIIKSIWFAEKGPDKPILYEICQSWLDWVCHIIGGWLLTMGLGFWESFLLLHIWFLNWSSRYYIKNWQNEINFIGMHVFHYIVLLNICRMSHPHLQLSFNFIFMHQAMWLSRGLS